MFFYIYGQQILALRGKTTHKHSVRATMSDESAKLQIISQEVVSDVMNVGYEKFVISLSSLLELTLVCHVSGLSRDDFGSGVQKHIDTHRSRGFEPRRIYIDLQKALTTLQYAFPGVEVDVSGVGNHLDKVVSKTHRVKELIQCVVSRHTRSAKKGSRS